MKAVQNALLRLPPKKTLTCVLVLHSVAALAASYGNAWASFQAVARSWTSMRAISMWIGFLFLSTVIFNGLVLFKMKSQALYIVVS